MFFVSLIAALFTVIGLAQLIAGLRLVEAFGTTAPAAPRQLPPVSILKPLCGVDPLTELALESFCLIDYPEFQIVFGVQDAADPVIAVVERLRARYPRLDISLVVDAALHGSNRKISNLINMLPAAKHEVLVMSDADIHVPVYFLHRVLAALETPGTGLVTTLYSALQGTPHLATLLGSAQINYGFLPGALLARQLGRQDCLGVTMALTKPMLAEVGGLQAVANVLADDQVLGRLVRAKGHQIALAQVVPATTVADADFKSLFQHELRWARTIRALVPLPFAASVLQFSLFWALVTLLFAGGAFWAWALFAACLYIRYWAAQRIDQRLNLVKAGDAWLFLLRDLLSAAIYAVSYLGDSVTWRGQTMRADPGALPK